MASYSERRALALSRLHDLVAARTSWEEYQQQLAMREYDQGRAAEAAAQTEALEQEAQGKKNWLDDALTGAKMGSAAGPWGALAGGIIGTAKGMYESVGQRRKEGDSVGKALLHTITDTPIGNFGALATGDDFQKEQGNKLNMSMLGDAAGAYMGVKGYKQRQDAMNATAVGQGGGGGEGMQLQEPSLGASSPGTQDPWSQYQGQYVGAGLRKPYAEIPQDMKLKKGWDY